MNTKKWVIASLVIFVVDQVLSILFHSVIMIGVYEATAHLWRPMEEMGRLMWMGWVSGLIWSFLFVFVFAKGYEGKGLLEGVRFGLLIGVFFGLPMSLGTYMSMPITGGIATAWLIYTVVDTIILGILAAVLYKPTVAAAKK